MYREYKSIVGFVLVIILLLPVSAFSQGFVTKDENGRALNQQSFNPGSSKSFVNSIGQRLIYIRPGSFMMGSNGNDKDESPVHRVTISRGFYMQATEVSQGQWYSVMRTRPWSGRPGVRDGNGYAVVYVTWNNVKEFIRRLSSRESRQYRLPTEAEWEYACRAGTNTAFHFGNDQYRLGDYAWYKQNAKFAGREYAQRIGTKRPNRWGLYNMHGNVYEWCEDWYDKFYYTSLPVRDPRGPSFGTHKVIRGVSWADRAASLRSANRNRTKPNQSDRYIGFRVVCTR